MVISPKIVNPSNKAETRLTDAQLGLLNYIEDMACELADLSLAANLTALHNAFLRVRSEVEKLKP